MSILVRIYQLIDFGILIKVEIKLIKYYPIKLLIEIFLYM